MIVWGRQDAIVPLECAERYYQGIADSQLTVLDACGHYPQLEKPHDFTTAVRSFQRFLGKEEPRMQIYYFT